MQLHTVVLHDTFLLTHGHTSRPTGVGERDKARYRLPRWTVFVSTIYIYIHLAAQQIRAMYIPRINDTLDHLNGPASILYISSNTIEAYGTSDTLQIPQACRPPQEKNTATKRPG